MKMRDLKLYAAWGILGAFFLLAIGTMLHPLYEDIGLVRTMLLIVAVAALIWSVATVIKHFELEL